MTAKPDIKLALPMRFRWGMILPVGKHGLGPRILRYSSKHHSNLSGSSSSSSGSSSSCSSCSRPVLQQTWGQRHCYSLQAEAV